MTRHRLVAAALTVLAAGLLVAGSFLPSTVTDHFSGGSRDQELLVTSWTRTFDPPLEGEIAEVYRDSHVPLFGIPLAVAAAGLLAAAVVSFLTRRWSPIAARTTVVAAATGAVAAAFMLGMDVDSTLSFAGPARTDSTRNGTVSSVGIGCWLVAGGAVLALAAAVVLLRRAGPDPADVTTPPMGFRPPDPGGYPQGLPPSPGPPPSGSVPGPALPPPAQPYSQQIGRAAPASQPEPPSAEP